MSLSYGWDGGWTVYPLSVPAPSVTSSPSGPSFDRPRRSGVAHLIVTILRMRPPGRPVPYADLCVGGICHSLISLATQFIGQAFRCSAGRLLGMGLRRTRAAPFVPAPFLFYSSGSLYLRAARPGHHQRDSAVFSRKPLFLSLDALSASPSHGRLLVWGHHMFTSMR